MKNYTINENIYLDKSVAAFYNCDYLGYQKEGNPDFINHLKNMSATLTEIELIEDFIKVADTVMQDLKSIVENNNYYDCAVCVIPRSKAENHYKQSQLMFKKAVSSAVNKLGFKNATEAIKRVKDTKTTHNWRLENNTGNMPYVGITKDTCSVDANSIKDKNIILVDDIYTEGVNVAEDCIKFLFDLGAKNVILYTIAKTRD